jgi:cytochrome P450
MTGTLFDADLLADPHTGYARLRQAGPVHRTATPDGAPVWLVTRYADVRAAGTPARCACRPGPTPCWTG